MIILHDSNCKDFNNNGIGILKDALKCEVSEALNGELVLDMEYPITSKYIESIVNENIIKCDAGLGEDQLFRIKHVKPNFDTITIYGEHITYDLADNFLEDVFPQNLNGAACLDWILSHTLDEHNFNSFSDIQVVASARYVRKNPIEAIVGDLENSFVNLWGGELERNNYTIKMLNRRGNDKGYKIKYRKNLTGLDFTIDNSNIVTKVMPQGYNGLFLPEKYIDSPLINNYPHKRVKVIEFSNVKVKENADDKEGYSTKEEAYEELRRLCDLKYSEENIDKPTVNLKVDFVDLSQTTEYQNYTFLESVSMGDTVTVELDYTQVEVRVIKTTYDSLLHRYTKLELGEFKANYITDSQKDITNTIRKEADTIETSVLEQAKQNATEQLTAALGGYVYKTQNELFIMDTDNPNTAKKVWRWNLNGLGYSKNGINGPYELAMTQDGKIVADFITTGVLDADLITAGTIKSANYKSNVSGTSISLATGVIDSAKFKVNAEGNVTATGGDIGGFELNESSLIKDISGLYNYTNFDKVLIAMHIMEKISVDSNLLNILDTDNSGSISAADYTRMANIIKGTTTNTKKVAGTFEINANNTKDCLVIKDNKGNVVLSLGLGGINSSFIAANQCVIGKAGNTYNDSTYVAINGTTGNISATGTITQSSLNERKKNFEKLNNALDIIKRVDIYKYNLKNENDEDKKHIGIVIGKNYKYAEELTNKDNDCIELYSLASVCIQAIKEQQLVIENLEKRVKSLEEESDEKNS